MTMVLVIDNYDSFTYNLVQYLGELGAEVRVRRNDQVTLDEIGAMAPEQIVISPGPGRPEDAGRLAGRHPAVRADDADPRRLPRSPGDRRGLRRHGVPRHGADARQDVDRRARRQGACSPASASPFLAGRYHSLVIVERRRAAASSRWRRARRRTARSWRVRHRSYPVHGVQFHPESVLTDEGRRILRNFLDL